MKNRLAVEAVGILLATGSFCFARESLFVNVDHVVRGPGPLIHSICVQPILNFSHRPLNMEAIADVLVAHLENVGFQAHKSSDNAGACEAIVNAEVVEVSGHLRKRAQVDFRLTLVTEEVPRLSSSASGRSDYPNAASRTVGMHFAAPREHESVAIREAIEAAVARQARQIQAANIRGLPPWLPSQEFTKSH